MINTISYQAISSTLSMLLTEFVKIAKRMVKINQDILGEQCIRSDDVVLAVIDEDKKVIMENVS